MSNFVLPEALAVLERAPATYTALLDGLPEAWAQARERPDSWNSTEIIAHLVHGERTDWVPRARTILENGESQPFTPYDRAGHADDASHIALPELLATFQELRTSNLQTLDEWHLTPEQLQQTGMHPALGRVTLENLLATWVVHDLAHMKQMTRALATRYRDAVGPWNHANYLRILQDVRKETE